MGVEVLARKAIDLGHRSYSNLYWVDGDICPVSGAVD
jgi:hypothetical protein